MVCDFFFFLEKNIPNALPPNSSAVMPTNMGTFFILPLRTNSTGESVKNVDWSKFGSITGLQ